MDTLVWSPGIDIGHRASSSLTPLSFATAVIATVEEPEDECETDEADEENDEHNYPFVMGGHPIEMSH